MEHDNNPERIARQLVSGEDGAGFISCNRYVRDLIATAIRQDRATASRRNEIDPMIGYYENVLCSLQRTINQALLGVK